VQQSAPRAARKWAVGVGRSPAAELAAAASAEVVVVVVAAASASAAAAAAAAAAAGTEPADTRSEPADTGSEAWWAHHGTGMVGPLSQHRHGGPITAPA